jgi:hypothetical protein
MHLEIGFGNGEKFVGQRIEGVLLFCFSIEQTVYVVIEIDRVLIHAPVLRGDSYYRDRVKFEAYRNKSSRV